jgi:pyridoxine 4-dehydrogenase
VEKLAEIAKRLDATPAQVAIAWVAAQGDDIQPLIGARSRTRLTEALGALKVTLSAGDLTALNDAFPHGVAAGTRYPEVQMQFMDSERGKH